jgi:hypothetical protein
MRGLGVYLQSRYQREAIAVLSGPFHHSLLHGPLFVSRDLGQSPDLVGQASFNRRRHSRASARGLRVAHSLG